MKKLDASNIRRASLINQVKFTATDEASEPRSSQLANRQAELRAQSLHDQLQERAARRKRVGDTSPFVRLSKLVGTLAQIAAEEDHGKTE